MTPNDLSIEEALVLVLEKAAMLQYLINAVGVVRILPAKEVLNGMGDVCADIEDLAGRVKGSLRVEALNISLRKVSRR